MKLVRFISMLLIAYTISSGAYAQKESLKDYIKTCKKQLGLKKIPSFLCTPSPQNLLQVETSSLFGFIYLTIKHFLKQSGIRS